MFAPDLPLYILHLVVPVQEMVVLVALFIFEHLEGRGDRPLVIGEPGLRDLVVVDFVKVGEQFFEIFTRFFDNCAHPEQHNAEILILPNEETHSQVLRMVLPPVQQFVRDIETGQISVSLVVLPHCFRTNQEYLVDFTSPECDLPLFQPLQQMFFAVHLPEYLPFYGIYGSV